MAGGDRRNADPVLIAALAGWLTNLKAGKQDGVSEKTVYRAWLMLNSASRWPRRGPS